MHVCAGVQQPFRKPATQCKIVDLVDLDVGWIPYKNVNNFLHLPLVIPSQSAKMYRCEADHLHMLRRAHVWEGECIVP